MGQSTSTCKICGPEINLASTNVLAFCEKCKKQTVENDRLKEEDFQKVVSTQVNQTCYNCSGDAEYFVSTCQCCHDKSMNDTIDCAICHQGRQGPIQGYFCEECMNDVPAKKREWYMKNNSTEHPDRRCFSCWTQSKVYRIPVCQTCYDSETVSENHEDKL